MEVNKWAHLDIAGVMESHGEVHYLSKGLSGMGNSLGSITSFPEWFLAGRPTRSLIEFIKRMYGDN